LRNDEENQFLKGFLLYSRGNLFPHPDSNRSK
jgi:hypothetical protein